MVLPIKHVGDEYQEENAYNEVVTIDHLSAEAVFHKFHFVPKRKHFSIITLLI